LPDHKNYILDEKLKKIFNESFESKNKLFQINNKFVTLSELKKYNYDEKISYYHKVICKINEFDIDFLGNIKNGCTFSNKIYSKKLKQINFFKSNISELKSFFNTKILCRNNICYCSCSS